MPDPISPSRPSGSPMPPSPCIDCGPNAITSTRCNSCAATSRPAARANFPQFMRTIVADAGSSTPRNCPICALRLEAAGHRLERVHCKRLVGVTLDGCDRDGQSNTTDLRVVDVDVDRYRQPLRCHRAAELEGPTTVADAIELHELDLEIAEGSAGASSRLAFERGLQTVRNLRLLERGELI